MPAGEVRVDGARKLRSTLRAAGDDLSNFKTTHAYAASIAAAEARRQAPVGPPTIHLRDTIRSSGTKTAALIRAGNNSTVRYGPPIHWGWHRRHIKANPFLSRGAQISEPRWIKVYEDYLEAAIGQIEGI